MPGGKAITERGSLCCSCRTFQSPKKRADAQGKPDPSLMSESLSHSPSKPRPSPQFSPSCPPTMSRYKYNFSPLFNLKSFHMSLSCRGSSCHSTVHHLTWATAAAVQTLRKCWIAMVLMETWCATLAAMQCPSSLKQ